MKKLTIAFLAIITIILSCKKYKEIDSDLNDNLYIFGRLFIQDSINGNGTIKPLLAETTIKLSYKGNTTNSLYSVKSNAEGYFTFPNLSKNRQYTIYAESTTGDGAFKAIFSVSADVSLSTSNETVSPLLTFDNNKQNGVLFTIRDNTNPGFISDCNTCFFGSRQLWLTDTCANGLFTIPSNINGKVLKTNILPGKYYLLFKKQAGVLLLQAKDSIDILNKGIVRKDIILQ